MTNILRVKEMRTMPDFRIEGLTLHEFSILDCTNDPEIDQRSMIDSESVSVITTKGFYFWAILICEICNHHPELESDDLRKALRLTLEEHEQQIVKHYTDIKNQEGIDVIDLVKSFLRHLNIETITPEDIHHKRIEVEDALLKKGLIEDPITTSIMGMSAAVIGLIPYGFTSKTRRGRTVYRRIRAMLWEYEMSSEKGETKKKLTFRFYKILRAFKQAFVEGFEDTSEKPKE